MLTLRVVKGRASGTVRTVDKMGLVVGRGSACDWILPDPERVLSSRHFRVDVVDNRYLLTDTSSNGVFHNHATTPIGRDGTVSLTDGDTVSLGDYEMAVTIGEASSTVDTWSDVSSSLDDPFGLNAPAGGFVPPPPPATESDHIPLHHEFFAPPSVSRSETPPPIVPFVAPPSVGGSDVGLAGELPDDWFLGLGPAPTPDPPPAPVFTSPSAAPDPFDPIPPPDFQPPPVPAPVVESPVPFVPPPERPAAVPPPLPPAPLGPVVAARSSTEGAAIAAFLAGAGLPSDTMEDLDPVATMRIAGAVFRGLIEGLSGLMTTRSEMKNEFRIERTLIASQDNNPLKFSLDATETARWLLEPTRPGFLPAEESVRQGVRDLRRHELAVGVGMRSALDALLHRFDPAHIKAKEDKSSALDKVIPSARPARWWEAYEKFYAGIVVESEDDFQSLFARDFAQAYETQMKALAEADFKADDKNKT